MYTSIASDDYMFTLKHVDSYNYRMSRKKEVES